MSFPSGSHRITCHAHRFPSSPTSCNSQNSHFCRLMFLPRSIHRLRAAVPHYRGTAVDDRSPGCSASAASTGAGGSSSRSRSMMGSISRIRGRSAAYCCCCSAENWPASSRSYSQSSRSMTTSHSERKPPRSALTSSGDRIPSPAPPPNPARRPAARRAPDPPSVGSDRSSQLVGVPRPSSACREVLPSQSRKPTWIPVPGQPEIQFRIEDYQNAPVMSRQDSPMSRMSVATQPGGAEVISDSSCWDL